MRRKFLSAALAAFSSWFTSRTNASETATPKRAKLAPNPQGPQKLVLCIPGPWASRTEFLTKIVEASGGYLFAGRVLMHSETKFACELVFDEADSRMHSAFSVAGPHWRDIPQMHAIKGHRSVVYLVGHGGSRRNADLMILAAAGIVRAGGLGVKVESSGIAHAPEKWLDFAENIEFFSAHDALVVYVTGAEVYSCGMHNFGLREAITRGTDAIANVELLSAFTRYIFREAPVLREGQTFSTEASAPVYRLRNDHGVQYGADSLFNNSLGAWRLVPL